MSTDEDPQDEAMDLVVRHCGAGHPLQLPSGLYDAVGARFASALRQHAPAETDQVRPERRTTPSTTPSRERPSRSRREPRVRHSASELTSEAGPVNQRQHRRRRRRRRRGCERGGGTSWQWRRRRRERRRRRWWRRWRWRRMRRRRRWRPSCRRRSRRPVLRPNGRARRQAGRLGDDQPVR